MPVFKDTERNTFYVKCYYTDYTGTKRQKKKRGFKLQREAKEWERNFLKTQQAKDYEAQIEELYKQIGKLTAQYEWMKKKSGIQFPS